MDAVKYLREKKRMCLNHPGCRGCPMKILEYCNVAAFTTDEERIKAVQIVEQWAAEHHVMTNAQKFEEVFGEKPDRSNGGRMCPPIAFRKSKDCNINCFECKQWWDEPYKEPER